MRSIVDHSGTAALLVNVECHITNGLPAIIIIGYASKAVDEAKDRLRASFANCSIQFPKKRVTLNLSPADIPKDSTSLDLSMAVAVLSQSGQIQTQNLSDYIFLGEIGLDGAAQKLDISARSYVRTVKVARTIADLEKCPDIKPVHISGALQYRYQSAAMPTVAYGY